MKNFKIILLLTGITILGSCQKEEIVDETTSLENAISAKSIECDTDSIFPSKFRFFTYFNNPICGYSDDSNIGYLQGCEEEYCASLKFDKNTSVANLTIQKVPFPRSYPAFHVSFKFESYNTSTRSWNYISGESRDFTITSPYTPMNWESSPYGPVSTLSKIRVVVEIWINNDPSSGRNLIIEYNPRPIP